MLSLLAAGEDVIIFHQELPIPALAYGIIAMVGFTALAMVTWSYRHVANRHAHKVDSHSGHH